jgi:hypothetical protein
VFGHGSFAPDSPEGKYTLAHELAHVQQQRKGPVSGTDTGSGVAVSHPSDAFEQEAEATASRALSGPQPVAGTPAPPDGEATVPSAQRALQRAAAVQSVVSRSPSLLVQRVGEGTFPRWLAGAGQVVEKAAEGAVTGLEAISAAAIAVAAAAGAAVLTWSSNADMDPAEEQQILSQDRAIQALRAIVGTINEIGAITLATMTAEEINRLLGQVQGAIGAVNDFAGRNVRELNKCNAQLEAFKAAAQALLDALSQPPESVNRFRILGLLNEFQQAMSELLACMGAVPGSGP